MHDCPDCGQACFCDHEDHYNEMAADECTHECEPETDDDWAAPEGEEK